MSGTIEKREDGSIALFINGDLQFDSCDERIYHESLALPALALACHRNQSPLRALIIGGGDGLTARELFKSKQIGTIDLVDYDPQIIEFARREVSDLNEGSLDKAALTVHVQDAWQFVEDAVAKGVQFDLVISDLTVPEDVNGARFHTIDWYEKLSALVGEKGIIAVNGCSPQATPQAYCSILNSLLSVKLHVRPYHATIPSFSKLGYGDDWGFFVASAEAIEVSEFDSFELITPRHYLNDAAALKQLFVFSDDLLKHQAVAMPALVGSGILLNYFNNSEELITEGAAQINVLNWDTTVLAVPSADNGKTILSPNLSLAVKQSLSNSITIEKVDSQEILAGVINLVPTMYREHTPEIVSDFLANPGSFLQGLDLKALINALLRRAKDLPGQLVAELESLRDRLEDWAEDNLSVLSLGHQVLTVLTLVIVLGNLLYPDMVYAKGHGHDGGRGGYGSTWVDGNTNWVNPVYQKRPVIDKTIIEKPVIQSPGVKQLPPQSNLEPKDAVRLQNRLTAKKEELNVYLDVLKQELARLEAGTEATVAFGTHNIAREEAVRRTNLSISKTGAEIEFLQKQLDAIG